LALVVFVLAVGLSVWLLPELVRSTNTRFIRALGVTFTVSSVLWLATSRIVKRFDSLTTTIVIIQYALMITGALTTYWALLADSDFQWTDLLLTALLGIVTAVGLLAACWTVGPWRPYTPAREVWLSMTKRAIECLDDRAVQELQEHIGERLGGSKA
jgi:hypothetical protein